MQRSILKNFYLLKTSHKAQKIATLIGLLTLMLLSYFYWSYQQRYVRTDDSYLNANVVQIAPRVTGLIKDVYIRNNQWVKQGQALFDIDAEPFQVTVSKAEAQLDIDQANLQDASNTAKRTYALLRKKILPPQASDDVTAKLDAATATLHYARASLKQAQLDLKYTRVYAPVSGFISNMSVRAGNIVTANQPLFALIDKSEFWADANYKETQLEQVRLGQSATIAVDIYPQHIFRGHVESISGSSGTAFSLLPPQNATGNWVKVTQRVPVKIHIDTDSKYPLYIGTSATVVIDTHSAHNTSQQ